MDKGFVEANNIVFRLAASESDGQLDGSVISGAISLRGTNQSDTLIGNDQSNVIFLLSDARGGPGLGVDTVSARDGDDSIRLETMEWGAQWSDMFSGYDAATNSYLISGAIDGGAGNDELVVSINHGWWHNGVGDSYNVRWGVDLTQLSMTNLESLVLSNSFSFGLDHIMLTASQVASLGAIKGAKALIVMGGGDVDLDHLASIGITTWRIGDAQSYNITGTSASDVIAVAEGLSNIDAGAGNDIINIDNASNPSNTISGGEGADTLVIKGSDVDLSQTTLSGIEEIRVSSQSLALSETQWASLGDTITVLNGANTEFTLALEVASTKSLEENSNYAGFSGSAEADRLIGNSADNILVGNAGNDVLEGKAGADTLVAGAGTDELYGGEGDDRLDVSNKDQVSDIVSGGSGTDTLLVSDGQNLTGATLTGLEVLSGTGTVTMSAEQVSLFKEIRGVSVQLTGDAQSYEMPSTLRLVQGAEVLLPDVDSDLVGSGGLIGSVKDDLLAGSAACRYAPWRTWRGQAGGWRW